MSRTSEVLKAKTSVRARHPLERAARRRAGSGCGGPSSRWCRRAPPGGASRSAASAAPARRARRRWPSGPPEAAPQVGLAAPARRHEPPAAPGGEAQGQAGEQALHGREIGGRALVEGLAAQQRLGAVAGLVASRRLGVDRRLRTRRPAGHAGGRERGVAGPGARWRAGLPGRGPALLAARSTAAANSSSKTRGVARPDLERRRAAPGAPRRGRRGRPG